MTLQRVAGVAIIAGFALFFIASVMSPRGLYPSPGIDRRMEILAANQGRWVASQVAFGLAGLVPAIGFLLLTLYLRDSQPAWAVDLGAAAYLIGALSAATFVYLQTQDPRKYWELPSLAPTLLIYTGLTLAAVALYGVAFLQGGLPNWLGILAIGASAILGIVYVAVGGGIDFVVGFALYAVTLVVGIVLLRT